MGSKRGTGTEAKKYYTYSNDQWEEVQPVMLNAETVMLASQEAARKGITLKHYIEALITVALVQSLPEKRGE